MSVASKLLLALLILLLLAGGVYAWSIIYGEFRPDASAPETPSPSPTDTPGTPQPEIVIIGHIRK